MDERERLRRKWFTPEELEEMRQADVEIEREFEADPQAFTNRNSPKFVYTYEGIERRKPVSVENGVFDLWEDGRLVLEASKETTIADYLYVHRSTVSRYIRGLLPMPDGIEIKRHESE